MIAFLTGSLLFKSPGHITVDVHGVGYEVLIPLSTFYSLPDLHGTVSLSIHTHLREDAIQLFGFATAAEKEAFVLLTSVSGIGPKLALSVLSALSVGDLASAVEAGDVDKLATVPGIGKKSAGRLALELKDKVNRLRPSAGTPVAVATPGDQVNDDALSALVNLGYRAGEARDALARVSRQAGPALALKDLIREALKDLVRGYA